MTDLICCLIDYLYQFSILLCTPDRMVNQNETCPFLTKVYINFFSIENILFYLMFLGKIRVGFRKQFIFALETNIYRILVHDINLNRRNINVFSKTQRSQPDINNFKPNTCLENLIHIATYVLNQYLDILSLMNYFHIRTEKTFNDFEISIDSQPVVKITPN